MLQSKLIQCPYCGERVEVLVDCSIEQQDYIEDCHVCCCPINLSIAVERSGDVVIVATHENE